MEIVKVVEWLKKILKTRQDNVNEAVTSDVKTLEEYKYLLGKLHAYKEIIQELTDLLKKQERYEDEAQDFDTRD